MAHNSESPSDDAPANCIDAPTTPDVPSILESVAADAHDRVDDNSPDRSTAADAVHGAPADAALPDKWSSGQHAYALAWLDTYVGLDQSYIVESVAVQRTTIAITRKMAEDALSSTLASIVAGSLSLEYHDNGTASVVADTRSHVEHVDRREALRHGSIDDPNWREYGRSIVARVAESVDRRLPNAADEHAAMHDAIEAHRESIWSNVIQAAVLLDVYRAEYGVTGSACLVGEQVEETALEDWAAVISSGMLWHATAEAAKIQRDE